MGRKPGKIPKINRNVVAAAVLALIISVTIIGLELQSSSPVDRLFVELQTDLLKERWNAVAVTTGELHTKWKSRKPWLALKDSRNAIEDFDRRLARLQAAVSVQDKSAALSTTAELAQMWNGFSG